jgi:hypothetical protein
MSLDSTVTHMSGPHQIPRLTRHRNGWGDSGGVRHGGPAAGQWQFRPRRRAWALAPMDVTDSSPQRIDLGVERFLKGDTLVSERVVFWKDPAGSLCVYSYSDFNHASNSSAVEASAKIERSKRVEVSIA